MLLFEKNILNGLCIYIYVCVCVCVSSFLITVSFFDEKRKDKICLIYIFKFERFLKTGIYLYV